MKKIKLDKKNEIEEIILSSNGVCSLSMIDNGKPYCIPMNFGYDSGIIYFHGAPNGRKIEVLNNNPDVCVSFYSNAELNVRHENVACSYSMKFKSVLAHGKISFVDDVKEKQRIMNIIMKNYSGRDNFVISKPALENVNMFYLEPTEVTAFSRGYSKED